MALKPPEFDPELKAKINAVALLSVNLAANPEHHGNPETAKFKAGFGVLVLRPNEKDKRQVQLHLEITHDTDPSDTPYLGKMVAMTEVGFAKSDDPDMMDKIAGWMSISPLVGMVRTYLDMLSAVGPYTRLMLNTVSQSGLMQAAQLNDGKDVANNKPLYPDMASMSSAKKVESTKSQSLRKATP